MIISSPCSLSILNQFEQPMSEHECNAMGRYPALRILDIDARLGNQLTLAIKAEAGRKGYFLLKGEGDKTEGPASVYRRTFKGCTVRGDTVEILHGRSIALHRRYPAEGGSWKAREKERLVRLFEYGGYCYVSRPGGRPDYGWCAREQTAWKKVAALESRAAAAAPAANDDSLPPAFVERLESRVDAANDAYRVYFRHFDALAGQRKSVPMWTRQVQENGLAWTLSNPYARTGELDESSRQLAQELAMLLLGRPFRAAYSDGVLRVERVNATVTR